MNEYLIKIDKEIFDLHTCPFCKLVMKPFDYDKLNCKKCGKKYRLDVEELRYLTGEKEGYLFAKQENEDGK